MRRTLIRSLFACLCVALLSARPGKAADQPGAIDSLLTESAQRLADGDYEGAVRDASLALQLDPKNPAAYEARGSVYIEEKLWDRAERDYTSAAKLSPDVVYKFKLAEIKFRQKAYEDACPRFVALKSDPHLGDLATYQAFLCDLLGGHESWAVRDLAERDREPAGPSLYFCHAAWDLFHDQRAEAGKCFSTIDHLYDHSITERYIAILIESRRFSLATATFTDRSGQSYTNASVFLESAGLRVSTPKGWVTLTLDRLPADLASFPEDLREQINRKRAVQDSPTQPPRLVSFTTKSGQKHVDVRWTLDATGLSVLTPDGWTPIAFADLPDDLSVFPPELRSAIIEQRRAAPIAPDAISFTSILGKSYREVRAALVHDGIRVLTPNGWITVPYRELPDDVSSFPADWQSEIKIRRQEVASDVTEPRVISFTTRRGTHYNEVRVSMEKAGLRVMTPDGLIAVPYSQLPTDLSAFPKDWQQPIAEKVATLVKTTPPNAH